MALASSMPCIDRLACQLSVHRIDEHCTRKPDFYLPLNEPLDLDYAERHRSNPKRSRSLPNASVTKRKDAMQLDATREHLASVKRTRDRDKTPAERNNIIKEEIKIHSTRPYTSPGHLTLSVNKYANEANRHKDSEADQAESSDDEVSGLLLNSLSKANEAPRVLAEITSLQTSRENTSCKTGDSFPRKRSMDENEYHHDIKRLRPRLDFDKMQLSRNGVVRIARSEHSFFEDVYFKPIAPLI